MTAVSFTQVNSLNKLTNVVNGAAANTNGADFSEVLKANTNKSNDISVQNSDSTKTKKSYKSDKDTNLETATKQADDQAKGIEEKTESVEKSSADKNSAEVVDETTEIPDEITEAAAQAMIAIAQIMNVDVAEVETAVEELGLTDIAVLDETKIQDIALEVAGVEDPVELMTDEALYNDVKVVSEAVAEIVDEIDLPKEEVKDIITTFEIQAQETEVGKNLEEFNIKPIDEKKDDNNSEANLNLTQSIVDNIKAAATTQSAETETNVYSTDMNDIYEQISEGLKLNLTEDVTEMEINLHPASLGNVKVQVAAKDGVITANFTTQNETVKAALETQIIQLKESMDEQGIKVEAIEVNVAAHAFDENLSKEGESSNSNEAQKSRKRRSINLNEIDEIDDNNIVEDEIRIAREMMMANGTTVDYMA